MNSRLGLLLLPLVLWTCATPAPVVRPPVAPVVTVDDDHRLVSREEFHASPWRSLGSATSWIAEGQGIRVTLADGRQATLGFVAPGVVRWWVPAAREEAPLSPAARFSQVPVTVKVSASAGLVLVTTPSLSIQFNPEDLTWVLLRGEKAVLKTCLGPQASGRRLVQDFETGSATHWFGPGLEAPGLSAHFWIDAVSSDASGTFAAPALVGAGGTLPFAVALDNSYQTYTRVTSESVRLGALNGGLDLLVSAAPQPAVMVEGLTAVLGRPPLLPYWAFGTALALPDTETGAFVRQAKLSIQTFSGAFGVLRTSSQSLVPLASTGPLPDLSDASTTQAWIASRPLPVVAGTGIVLPAVWGRSDWSARFDDEGKGSLLARMNNRLPGLEARAVSQAWQASNPGLRPFVLAASGAWGSVRDALPEVRVTAGNDRALLDRALVRGAAGLATPAMRLDLTPLAEPATRAKAFQSLLLWSLAPVLTLDWGSDPAGFWNALGETDRKRLKSILDGRSQFKPVFAQAAQAAALTGRPTWQPLWFAAPNDAQALTTTDEFLLGDNLLVAPVLGGAPSRSVYLPGPGVWFDFWSGEEFGGGKTYEIAARGDRPLTFARGGSLIAQREVESFDEKDLYNPLTVHVFPGGRGSTTYYSDDGRTLGWKAGAYWETRIVFDFTQKEMSLDHQTVHTTASLKADPYLLYRIHNVFRPKQVKIDGKAIPLYGDSWGITDSDRSAAWYEGDHTLLLKTFRPEREQSIVLSF